MTIPTITPVTVVPLRSLATSGADFVTKVETFLNGLAALSTEINAVVAATNPAVAAALSDRLLAQAAALSAMDAYAGLVAADASASTGASASAVAIGTGAKAFAATTGRLWYAKMAIVLRSLANPANFMAGRVTSYDVATGALVVEVITAGGAGSPADWQIFPAGQSILSAGWNPIWSMTPVAQPSISFTSLPTTYTELRLRLSLAVSTTTALRFEVSDGTTWTTAQAVTNNFSTANPAKGALHFPAYTSDEAMMHCAVSQLPASPASGSAQISAGAWGLFSLGVTGGVKGIRISPASGTISGSAALEGKV